MSVVFFLSRKIKQTRPCKPGFTLAELLIALGILGVIAAFTIPKILTSQQNQQYNAMAKEAASTLVAAMQQAQQDGALSSSSKPSALLPYINYVALDSSLTLDVHPNWGGMGGGGPNGTGGATCTSTAGLWPCARLHNGGTILFVNSWSFGGTTDQHGVMIIFDPDSMASGSSSESAPGKAVGFVLYYTGRIATVATQNYGTCNSGGCNNYPNPIYDPTWFSF